MERTGGIVNTLLVALFEQNTGHLLLPFINYTLVALLFVIFVAYLYGFGSIHLVVLTFLAMGLMTSINWYPHSLSLSHHRNLITCIMRSASSKNELFSLM
jgi:hypothetical protein